MEVKPKVIDVFTYNGEKDIARLRFNMLYHHVDQFIVVEARHTFTGLPKPLYYERHLPAFTHWLPKIKYHIIDENYSQEERMLAEESAQTQGAPHWKTEFLQKESIKKALQYLTGDDIVYIGDVDEIWDATLDPPQTPTKLKLKVFAYYLDNHSSEEFWGTLVSPFKYIKDECLNHLRQNAPKSTEYGGWHFTSMGGLTEVKRKLNSSYTIETYNTHDVQYRLPERVRMGTDYLGRPFTFKVDESDWPQYLKKNRPKYAHLCKGLQVTYGPKTH